jgi:hypothetical protein
VIGNRIDESHEYASTCNSIEHSQSIFSTCIPDNTLVDFGDKKAAYPYKDYCWDGVFPKL